MLHLGTLPLPTKKLYPISKQCFIFIVLTSNICVLSIPFFYIGEKRLRGHPSSEETRDPPPLEEGEIHPRQTEQEEEDVVEFGTTTGDRDVVDPDPFTSESAQILIGEIMGYNRDLENMKKNINDVLQKNKNIIDVLGRV
ncbi:hypothetical protein AB205_0069850 [Aquarana catesbeiana]|uniref:Uncharacterized protein n=1 Tax=Aquarana catesbeiana TaxID=8400 RepID=A0A2G9SH93_AQUCT|nr:hypothetical protein AB205_0069850 [Aquarana catesbeiana]